MIRLFLVSLSVLGLIACAERDQSISGAAIKSDGDPWQGAQNDFVARGWTPGNKGSWERQIHTRGQNQNEDIRIN